MSFEVYRRDDVAKNRARGIRTLHGSDPIQESFEENCEYSRWSLGHSSGEYGGWSASCCSFCDHYYQAGDTVFYPFNFGTAWIPTENSLPRLHVVDGDYLYLDEHTYYTQYLK